MTLQAAAIRHILMNPHLFSERIIGRALRPYQLEPLEATIDSVLNQRGHTITIMMARQMGKNETSAHLEAYLLTLFQRRNALMVKAAPTFKPQLVLSMQRLDQMLDNPWTRHAWSRTQGYIYRLGKASLAFLSAAPGSSVVGHTANLLLELDEAQNIEQGKFDVDLKPMTATTAATVAMYGTAWTSDTLLANQIEQNLEDEAKDGIRRHFVYPWHVLSKISPTYRQFAEGERARLGQDHPAWLTQYECKTVDDISVLFTTAAIAGMRSTRPRGELLKGTVTVAGLDPAGEETAPSPKHSHDRAALLIGSAGRTEAGDAISHVASMFAWQGQPHHEVIPLIAQILDNHDVRLTAVDTTGMGEVWASMLEKRLGESRILRVTYSRPKKSELTHEIIAAANSGRLTCYQTKQVAPGAPEDLFWTEIAKALRKAEPGGLLSFSVPENVGHDDFVNALALIHHASSHLPTHAPAAEQIAPQKPQEEF